MKSKLFEEKSFDKVVIGETIADTITVSEAQLILAARLFKDYNPLHMNEEYARKSIFRGRIIHGPLTAGIMAGVIGNNFTGTAIAYMEQTVKFLTPVRPGDTLTTEWKVSDILPQLSSTS